MSDGVCFEKENVVANDVRDDVVRGKGLEPSRLWMDTGTSSLPVYLFQHPRISGRELL